MSWRFGKRSNDLVIGDILNDWYRVLSRQSVGHPSFSENSHPVSGTFISLWDRDYINKLQLLLVNKEYSDQQRKKICIRSCEYCAVFVADLEFKIRVCRLHKIHPLTKLLAVGQPDRPFRIFRASRSGGKQILFCSVIWFDIFWSYKFAKWSFRS